MRVCLPIRFIKAKIRPVLFFGALPYPVVSDLGPVPPSDAGAKCNPLIEVILGYGPSLKELVIEY